MAPLLPIPKNLKDVHSLVLQKASTEITLSKNSAIDTAAVQLEKMKVSELDELTKQPAVSTDRSSRKQ